jgi:hypothetical protein
MSPEANHVHFESKLNAPNLAAWDRTALTRLIAT